MADFFIDDCIKKLEKALAEHQQRVLIKSGVIGLVAISAAVAGVAFYMKKKQN